jgi:hypothetical protein
MIKLGHILNPKELLKIIIKETIDLLSTTRGRCIRLYVEELIQNSTSKCNTIIKVKLRLFSFSTKN